MGRGPVNGWDDAEVERAPICPQSGVTALPAEPSNVTDSPLVCENLVPAGRKLAVRGG